MKLFQLIFICLVLSSSLFAEKDGLDNRQIWTGFLVKAYSSELFNYDAYLGSWNDVENGLYLWVLSNKISHTYAKKASFGISYTFFDVQLGNKANNPAPLIHSFEAFNSNSFELGLPMSLSNKLENRYSPQKEDKWAFRYRLNYTLNFPKINSLPWLSFYAADEILLYTSEFQNFFTHFSETYTENRWSILGIGVKANEKVSFKIYPGIRFKLNAQDEWTETGFLGILFINTF